MKKVFLVIFLVLGSVIGAGFMTGKEIVTFFAKFGYFSLLMLPMLFMLFYWLFRSFLSTDSRVIEDTLKKPIPSILTFILNAVFASAMFSASFSLFKTNFGDVWEIILAIVLVLVTFFIVKGGLNSLMTINKIVVPFMIISLMILFLITFIKGGDGVHYIFSTKLMEMPIYSFLFIAYNTSLQAYLISKSGDKLTAKEQQKVALITSLILTTFIGLGILAICMNASLVLNSPMPFMMLAEKLGLIMQILISIAMFFGVFTTLLSFVFTIKESIDYKVKNDMLSSLLAIVLPLCVGFIGFETIIEYLYPFAGVVAIYLIYKLTIRQCKILCWFHKKKNKNLP